MIISRTPYRVSFFGGGTDYHTWYEEHGGSVLSTSIKQYCYLNCRFLPPFFEHKSKIVWSKVEQVLNNDDIEHPCINALLKHLNIDTGIEVHHQGDLPARAGLGSSSAFCVGLLNAMYTLLGQQVDKCRLACEAVHIERDLLQENVGVQDQIATAYGGLNKISIQSNGNFSVDPINIDDNRKKLLQDHCLLFFTGLSRTASHIAGAKMKAIPNKTSELRQIQELVDIGIDNLVSGSDITDFGRLLDETWQLKRSISSKIAPTFIDDIYTQAMKAGALGGKLLGAGGGGFMLFFVEPEKHQAVMNALSDLLLVPFEMENSGSQIIFQDETSRYSHTSRHSRHYRHLKKPNIVQIGKFDLQREAAPAA